MSLTGVDRSDGSVVKEIVLFIPKVGRKTLKNKTSNKIISGTSAGYLELNIYKIYLINSINSIISIANDLTLRSAMLHD